MKKILFLHDFSNFTVMIILNDIYIYFKNKNLCE